MKIKINDLNSNDHFNFATIKSGKKNTIIPATSEWIYLRRNGLYCYYTDVKKTKEYFTTWKRPVFKINK